MLQVNIIIIIIIIFASLTMLMNVGQTWDQPEVV